MLATAARLGVPAEPGARFWGLTPAELRREADAHAEAEKGALFRTVYGACLVANRIPQLGGDAAPIVPSDFLPWLDGSPDDGPTSLDEFRAMAAEFDRQMAERDARQAAPPDPAP